MLTTAGVTFFTISAKPCAIEGGTPAAVAAGSPASGLRVQASAKTHTQLAKPRAPPFSRHVAMTIILRKVIQYPDEIGMNRSILHYLFEGLQRLIVPFGKHKPPERDDDDRQR
jgi:hypothetical protein